MAKKMFSVRLDEDLIAEIDAVDQKRSDFVRDALRSALGEPFPDRKELPEVPKKNSIEGSGSKAGLPSDAVVVLEAIKSKPRGSQDLEKHFSWLGLRYANAEKSLLASGSVRVVDGLLVAVE